MRFPSMWILAAGTAAALLLVPARAEADLILDTGSSTNGESDRGPGGPGFGQGVSVSTATNLTQMAMFLRAPNGGNFRYMLWDSSNTTLLLSDVVSVPASTTADWILSDPLSFALNSGDTYYFGAIQDSDTQLFAPFFNPPTSVSQHGLTTLTMNSNYEDFLVPIFTSFASAGFPLRLYGTQGSQGGGGGGTVPEPSMMLLLAAGLGGVIWWRRQTVR